MAISRGQVQSWSNENECLTKDGLLPWLQVQVVVPTFAGLLENVEPNQFCLHELLIVVSPPVFLGVLQHSVVDPVDCPFVAVGLYLFYYLEVFFAFQFYYVLLFRSVQLALRPLPLLRVLSHHLQLNPCLLLTLRLGFGFWFCVCVGMFFGEVCAKLDQVGCEFGAKETLDDQGAVVFLSDGGVVGEVDVFLEILVLELAVAYLAGDDILSDEYIVGVGLNNWRFFAEPAAACIVTHQKNEIINTNYIIAILSSQADFSQQRANLKTKYCLYNSKPALAMMLQDQRQFEVGKKVATQ